MLVSFDNLDLNTLKIVIFIIFIIGYFEFLTNL